MQHSLAKIGIIGGTGWLGSAIAESLLSTQFIDPTELWIANRSGLRTPLFEKWQDVIITNDTQAVVDHCDTIIISVKPHDFPALPITCRKNQLVISVMAGVSVKKIETLTHSSCIIRSMPNVAAQNRLSYTPWYSSFELENSKRKALKAFFQSFGTEQEVSTEDQINFLTALTGSGQGWIAFLESCFIDCAKAHGLPPTIANEAVHQLFLGMATNLANTNEPLDDLIHTLIEYAGTTAAGLVKFKASHVATDIHDAIHTSYLKAKSDMTFLKD